MKTKKIDLESIIYFYMIEEYKLLVVLQQVYIHWIMKNWRLGLMSSSPIGERIIPVSSPLFQVPSDTGQIWSPKNHQSQVLQIILPCS